MKEKRKGEKKKEGKKGRKGERKKEPESEPICNRRIWDRGEREAPF